MGKIVLYNSCHVWWDVLPMIHAVCHRATVHMCKSKTRHALRFKTLGFRSASEVQFFHAEVVVTVYRLHWQNQTRRATFHILFIWSTGYLVTSRVQPCIYTRSLAEGSWKIPSLNLVCPTGAWQKGFDLSGCISHSCAILCSMKNFNSFQALAHRMLTQLLYNHSIIQQYYEKDQKHRILQHLETSADKKNKLQCCL